LNFAQRQGSENMTHGLIPWHNLKTAKRIDSSSQPLLLSHSAASSRPRLWFRTAHTLFFRFLLSERSWSNCPISERGAPFAMTKVQWVGTKAPLSSLSRRDEFMQDEKIRKWLDGP
jgi:hypothetical protein